jgi:type II restriction/modification system DNA methylase subunit YeeA
MWIIDFGVGTPIEQAALYEMPFEYVREHVRPDRIGNRRAAYAQRWWLHVEPRSGMRSRLAPLSRYIATPNLTKHRLFVWLPSGTIPDHQLIVIARDDDYTFGVLHSRMHELWSLGQGTQLETRPRYTPTTTFETFPFPEATPEQRASIGSAVQRLLFLRNGWLSTSGPTDDGEERTLTTLYNHRYTWLQQAHAKLDAAVLTAYGWPENLSDDQVLARLLDLNLARSGGC